MRGASRIIPAIRCTVRLYNSFIFPSSHHLPSSIHDKNPQLRFISVTRGVTAAVTSLFHSSSFAFRTIAHSISHPAFLNSRLPRDFLADNRVIMAETDNAAATICANPIFPRYSPHGDQDRKHILEQKMCSIFCSKIAVIKAYEKKAGWFKVRQRR